MKILHVVHCYAPSRGGSQWLTQQLAEGCVRRHGDTATVFTTNAVSTASFWGSRDPLLPPGEERINGVTVRRFPFVTRLRTLRMAAASLAYRLRLPGNDWLRTCYQGPIVPGLAAAVAASGADVVFATAFPLRHMYDALAGARSSGIPLVYLGALHLDDRWGYDRASIYRAIAQCSAYIAHTAAERDHLVARGIAAAKIVEIGAGVDVGLFAAADGARIRREFGVGDRLVVGALGKQVERKRYDVLLAAMERVWQVHPTAVLLIAGATGSYTPALLAEVQRINASQPGRVVVLSDFAEAEKADILAAMDVFVLASGLESFGIAFVEAWACRRPVIGVETPAIASLIDRGRDGLLTPYGDPAALAEAVQALLAAPAQRQALGEAGHAKVQQRYTWDVIVDTVRAVYSRVLATP
jgi:glycosyltransferase involved in cell wall biosynthesis